MWLYRAYGLVIGSSLPIPEMTPIERNERPGPDVDVDVDIRVDTVPEHLDKPEQSSSNHEANGDHLLFRVPGVGRYLVSNGASIVVDPAPESTSHEVRVFMLGTCFGAILHQRGFLVMHASGIGTDRGAALFAGPSGSGKSTLLSELLRRGYRMMVDDVSAITLDPQGVPVVLPSYPRTRLWAETADRLGIETSGRERTRPTMDKFEFQVPQQFWATTAPLRRLYHLTTSTTRDLSLRRLDPIEAFPVVMNNTYRSALLDGFGLRRHHFDLATAVSARVPVVRVVRPADTFRLTDLADEILEDLLGSTDD